jgi:hypothetical protein
MWLRSASNSGKPIEKLTSGTCLPVTKEIKQTKIVKTFEFINSNTTDVTKINRVYLKWLTIEFLRMIHIVFLNMQFTKMTFLSFLDFFAVECCSYLIRHGIYFVRVRFFYSALQFVVFYSFSFEKLLHLYTEGTNPF